MSFYEEAEAQEMCLTSHPSNIVLVETFLDKFREEHHIGDEVYGNMLVAITEAVNNAIIHGNGTDHDKQVTVCLKHTGNRVVCMVEDEGGGFDYNQVPDPTAPENLTKEGGRGIFLMKHLSVMVIFSNDGSSVEIQFHI